MTEEEVADVKKLAESVREKLLNLLRNLMN
jgi:hypothetical protein